MRLGRLQTALLLACLGIAGCGGESAPPVAATVAGPGTAGRTYHLVANGQTLDDIARTYRVTKWDIVAANRLSAPYTVKAGTMLEIPLGAGPPAATAKAEPKHPIRAKPHPRAEHAAGSAVHAKNDKPKHSAPEIIPLD